MNNHVTKIPEVSESGATGNQEATSTGLVLQNQDPPFQPVPIAETIQGLAASNARNMGGAVAANLLSGSFSQLSRELQDAKSDLGDTRRELENVRDELSKSKTRAAVLDERVSTSGRQKHLRNVAIAGGSVILGLASQIDYNQSEALPFVLGAIGILFLVMGWFWPLTEKDR